MPLSTTCPSCKALFRLPEELAGRKVKCQKCQELFIVPRSESATTTPGVSAQVRETPEPEEDEQPTRVRAAPPPPYVKAAKEEDDDEEASDEDEDDWKPRKRSRERATRRPVKKRAAKSKSNALVWVLILGGVSLLLCVGVAGVGGLVYLIVRSAGGTNVEFGPDGTFRSDSFLSSRDPIKNGKHHKPYSIRMEAGRSYQIDMMSNQFDAFLVLIDPTGRIVAQDDDGGDGPLDARIIFRPQQTGDFRIETTSFGGRRTGAFTLIVRRL